MAMKLLPRGNHPNMLAIYFDIGCIHGQYAQEIRKRILPLLDYSFPSWSNIRNLYDQWQTHIKQRQQFFKDIVEQKLENFRENLESKPKIEQSKEKLRSMDQDAYHLQNTIKEKLILSSADWYTAKEEITSIKFLLNSNINKELPGTNKFAQANYFTIDNKLLLASFAMKETIEAAPILIYFSEKILHLPLPKLPDFLNNNIAFITMHYLACNLGMLSIGKLSILTPLALTATYASKIITYSYLAELKQDNFKNSDNKLINNPIDFINKCGFDIAAQTVLGVVGSVIAGTPFIYDVAISATISGMQCYDLHNQEKKNTTSSTAITIADLIPYIVDGAVLYASTRSMHFDLTIPIGKMAAIKQVYTVMSFVVIADYTTKLIMPNFQDTHLDYVTKAVGHIYEYFIGGVEAPEF